MSFLITITILIFHWHWKSFYEDTTCYVYRVMISAVMCARSAMATVDFP